MARHPADNLDDDPEVRALLHEQPPVNPAAFNINPGAAAGRISDWEFDHARRLREARDRAHARRQRQAPQWRWGGYTVLVAIFAVGFLCGAATMIIGL